MKPKSDFQKQIDKMDKDMERWKNTISSILENMITIRENGYRFYWIALNDEITSEQIERLSQKKIKLSTTQYINDENKLFIYQVKCEYPKELEELE